MPTWTDPVPWEVGQLVTAADLNSQLYQNLDWIKNPPQAHYVFPAEVSTTSTTFVDVPGASLTLTTAGGNVVVGLSASGSNSTSGGYVYLDIEVDGVRFSGSSEGALRCQSASVLLIGNVSFQIILSGLAAGVHTLDLQWRCSSNTARIYPAAQFWAMEVP